MEEIARVREGDGDIRTLRDEVANHLGLVGENCNLGMGTGCRVYLKRCSAEGVLGLHGDLLVLQELLHLVDVAHVGDERDLLAELVQVGALRPVSVGDGMEGADGLAAGVIDDEGDGAVDEALQGLLVDRVRDLGALAAHVLKDLLEGADEAGVGVVAALLEHLAPLSVQDNVLGEHQFA